jgi:microcystin-dependent protein
MAQPYVGEIRMFAGNFAPAGWMFCEGQLLPISEYPDLYNVIGTTYGGDGQNTIALPDLRGRVPVHAGNGFVLAQTGGAEEVTLNTFQIPAHTHALLATTSTANDANAQGNLLAQSSSFFPYVNVDGSVQMAPQSIGAVGGSQPHNNFQPYLCVDFIISLYGIFPSPT